jgi:hypothetical protein
MDDNNCDWHSDFKKIFDGFRLEDNDFHMPYLMAEVACSDDSLHNLYVSTFEYSIAAFKENKKDAILIFNDSHIPTNSSSTSKKLKLLINLYAIYMREYGQIIKNKSWQGQLENLFDTFVHQNTLEDAADYITDFSCEDKAIHELYVNLLQIAIANCRECKNDVMNVIGNGSGYMPQSIEETLNLVNELYRLYLQGKRISNALDN